MMFDVRCVMRVGTFNDVWRMMYDEPVQRSTYAVRCVAYGMSCPMYDIRGVLFDESRTMCEG